MRPIAFLQRIWAGLTPNQRSSTFENSFMTNKRYILKFSCPHSNAIAPFIANFFSSQDLKTYESHQYQDGDTGRFFMRVLFGSSGRQIDLDRLREDFARGIIGLDMTWSIRDSEQPARVLILVSLFDHCLSDILYRWRIGELPMTITAIVSNHPVDAYAKADFNNIPFHHLPITKETKAEQEKKLIEIIDSTQTDLVVLARYMQVFSTDLSAKLSGRAINIHHSFLPGFKGAKPYHQAHSYGVKVMGATAHYVTADLDEGPIIEQDVERISHLDSPDSLIRKGRDIERRVLARAIRYHLDDRVFLNGRKTVVFPD
ncbi:formyltetrahydrofolate deformylase PurU [Hyphomicrobium sp. MC1]|uniref:Formyltetrahydrofolate deformylase n=2 Tax=Pseudomonadota TaxID=1224 RepID=A0A0U2WZ15_ECOLX|nr:PurU [Escherichia coli]CCB65488.1 formyltetrahydrofolate deformylase PurU [Hyphomicrobium sp. MC1]